jgi:Tol biopolymer transport system component
MRLAYLAEGPYVRIGGNGVSGQFRPLASAVTSIVASGVIGPYVHPTALDASREVLATQPGAGELRALSYQPGGPLIATLRDAHQTGCWSPYLVNLPHYESVAPLLVPGLCVLNDLDSAAWTPDGRWLVVVAQVENAAHKPSGAPGLYALDIETRRFERLSDAPVDRTSAVAVRGAGDWLDIRPDAGPLPPETAAQSSVPRTPAGLDGTLVFSTTTSRGSEIYRMSLDGQAKWIPSPVAANQTCLALSPDGKQVAFLSNLDDASAQANGGSPGGDAGRGENEIFLADVDGGEWGQLTSPIAPYNTLALPAYDCPVWSPDGTLVAAALRTDLLPRLEVLRTDGQLLRSIPIDAPSTGVLPVWSPDGNTLFLAGPATGSRARASEYARVTTIKWRPPAGAATLLTLPGWDDVQAMAVSPDGKRLALVVVRQEPGSSALPSRAALEIYQLPGLGRVAEVNLSRYGYDPQAARSPGRMVWTGPDEVTLSLPRGLMASDKALLFTFDSQQMRLIARVPDALNGWALYPGWLVAGTDGGLYGIPLGPEGLNGPPLLLDPSPVDALDGH